MTEDLLTELRTIIPDKRVYSDELLRTAFSVDSSSFERIPEVVIDAKNEEEVIALLQYAHKHKIGITFRGSGTSLNGQCSGRGLLVRLKGEKWKHFTINEDASLFQGSCALLGEEISEKLQDFGKMIGPDPASYMAATFGGIVANNAAGMCCTVEQNTYATMRQIRIIFADGTILDTGDKESITNFRRSHAKLLQEIESIRKEVIADSALVERIKQKYQIKNTCGYSVNSFIDFSDPIDIIAHLLIGSEGTLGFVSNATLETLDILPLRATSLLFFPDLTTTIKAVRKWQDSGCAYALELFDSITLAAMLNLPVAPESMKDINPEACALLIETRAGNEEKLQQNIKKLIAAAADVEMLSSLEFFTDPEKIESLWAFRRALFPAVAGNKKPHEIVVLEDICFPIDKLEEGIRAVGKLFNKYGYPGGLNGHAFHGNFHFALPVDCSNEEEFTKMHSFIDEVMRIVVSFDGSLKAEHGTGYAVAPYVELEWGEQLYTVMKRVKKLLDPYGILNPGALLNDDPECHMKRIKQPVACDPLLDRCVDCGFCESLCPSKNVGLTPRQRVYLFRKIASFERSNISEDSEKKLCRVEEWKKRYDDIGTDLCATDGLCTTRCPMRIDMAEFVRKRRGSFASERVLKTAHFIGNHFPMAVNSASALLSGVALVQRLAGDAFMQKSSETAKKIIPALPLWNKDMPKGGGGTSAFATSCNSAPGLGVKSTDVKSNKQKVVYFPSCAVRAMGDSVHDPAEALPQVTVRVLERAGFDIIYPAQTETLCCGKAFETKGLHQEADRKAQELENALLVASNKGEYPILCETSPCLARMKKMMENRLYLYEPIEFAALFLFEKLKIEKKRKKIAIHPTCSTRYLGLAEQLLQLAQKCAEEVVWPRGIHCCGFSGDKGFHRPELNAAALETLHSRVADCEMGFSTSRTCEIGLSLHSGIAYRNIMYLLDECSSGN